MQQHAVSKGTVQPAKNRPQVRVEDGGEGVGGFWELQACIDKPNGYIASKFAAGVGIHGAGSTWIATYGRR